MAIKNGPGTVSSNVVFAYDIADTRNSYIGEPTTNLTSFDIASVSTNTDTPAQITVTSNSSEATYRGRLSKKISILSGYFNAYFYGYNTGVSSTKFSVSYKAKVSDGSHPSTIIGGGYIYGSAGSFFPSPTFTYLEDGWYLVTMLYSGTSMTLNSLTGMNGGGPGVIYITDYQAEAKDHPTPFAGVAGTRSSTQGLLDISGYANSINLANVSFNASANPTFDGTDDSMVVTNSDVFKSSLITVETIIKFNAFKSADLVQFGVGSGAYAQWYFRDLGNGNFNWFQWATGGNTYSDTTVSRSSLVTGKYYHIVCTAANATSTAVYYNGSLAGSAGSTVYSTPSSWTPADLTIGGFSWDGYSNTDIPIVRVYNKVLSSSEILQNYNSFKTRFNL